MSRVMSIINRIFNKEGKGKAAPTSGIASYLYLLYTNFWKLVLLNLLFIIVSLPLITLPASLVSLNRACIILVRERHLFVWEEFFTEFKRSFVVSLLMGILFFSLLFISYYLLSLGISNGENAYGIFFMAIGLLILVVTTLLGEYSLILVAMLDLPNRVILKNAFYMIMVDGKHAIYVLFTIGATIMIVFLMIPFSLGLVCLCLFAVVQYTICTFVNIPVQKWIIMPYEKNY